MTVTKTQVGLSEQLAVPPSALKTVPRFGSTTRPSQPTAPEGMVVQMVPIPGLTPRGLFTGNKAFVFHAPPMDSFSEDGEMAFDDYSTVGSGARAMPQSGPSLRTVTFNSVLLDWQPSWGVLRKAGWTPDPQAMRNELRKIKDSGKPFHLRASQMHRTSYDVDYAATIRQLHWELRAGEDDAYYITVGFVEHRSEGVDLFMAPLPDKLTVRTLPPTLDTLSKLALNFYGDPSKASLIAAANGIRNVPHSARLTVANTKRATLTIPSLKPVKKSVGQTRTGKTPR